MIKHSRDLTEATTWFYLPHFQKRMRFTKDIFTFLFFPMIFFTSHSQTVSIDITKHVASPEIWIGLGYWLPLSVDGAIYIHDWVGSNLAFNCTYSQGQKYIFWQLETCHTVATARIAGMSTSQLMCWKGSPLKTWQQFWTDVLLSSLNMSIKKSLQQT